MGPGSQFFRRRQFHQAECAVILVSVELGLAISLAFATWAQAFDVCNVESAAPGIMGNCPRKPTDGNETQQFGISRVKIEDRDCVLGGVANIQMLAGTIKRKR